MSRRGPVGFGLPFIHRFRIGLRVRVRMGFGFGNGPPNGTGLSGLRI